MQEVGLDGIRKVAGIAAQITIQRVEPWQTLLIGQNNSPHAEDIGRGNGVLLQLLAETLAQRIVWNYRVGCF